MKVQVVNEFEKKKRSFSVFVNIGHEAEFVKKYRDTRQNKKNTGIPGRIGLNSGISGGKSLKIIVNVFLHITANIKYSALIFMLMVVFSN